MLNWYLHNGGMRTTNHERSPLLTHHAQQQQVTMKPTKTSLRQDIWTVLRFRSSIAHSSGLQFASYVLELCVLVLILLNVILAISESSAVVDPNEPGALCGIK